MWSKSIFKVKCSAICLIGLSLHYIWRQEITNCTGLSDFLAGFKLLRAKQAKIDKMCQLLWHKIWDKIDDKGIRSQAAALYGQSLFWALAGIIDKNYLSSKKKIGTLKLIKIKLPYLKENVKFFFIKVNRFWARIFSHIFHNSAMNYCKLKHNCLIFHPI